MKFWNITAKGQPFLSDGPLHEEARCRNLFLVHIFSSIPSYCVWTDESVNEEDIIMRVNWWRETISGARANGIDIDTKDETLWPFVSIREYGYNWITVLQNE